MSPHAVAAAASSEPGSALPGTVLHLVASGGLYGIERMLVGLLPALRDLGCDAELGSLGPPDGAGGALGGALASLGVPVHYPATRGRFSLRGLARIEATIRRTRPAVVHLHGYKAIILAGPISLAKGIPTVATFHTEVLKTPGFAAHKKLEMQVVRRLHGMAAVSEPIRRELEIRGVRPDRIRVIPNGILDPAGRPAPAGPGGGRPRAGPPPPPGPGWFPPGAEPAEPTLVFMGRLVEGKNVHLLIDSVGELRAEFPEVRLLVAGEGPLRGELEARAAALGLQGAVRFLGFVDAVYPLLAGATCFVLPSAREGMPISLLEAMAVGVPTVATRVGSIPDVAADGAEAILVEADDPPALTDALRRILRDPALRKGMGQRARRRFLRDFTAERTAARYREFYQEVAGR